MLEFFESMDQCENLVPLSQGLNPVNRVTLYSIEDPI